MGRAATITTESPYERSAVSRRARIAWRAARRRPLGAAGAFIIFIMVLMAAFAELISPFNPLATDYGAMLQPPSSTHWLGTDSFGRDVWTRIIYGARTAL